MMRALFPLLLLLASCTAQQGQPIAALNPFPQGDLSDDRLVSDFQSLATDPRFGSYQLIRVQRGEVEAGQIYDVPFIAPKDSDLIIVAACGDGCTSPVLDLYDSVGKLVSTTTYIDTRAYIGLNIGTSPTQFRLDFSLDSCALPACSAYWALYAK